MSVEREPARNISSDSIALLACLSHLVEAGCEIENNMMGLDCHYCGSNLGVGDEHAEDCAFVEAEILIEKLSAR